MSRPGRLRRSESGPTSEGVPATPASCPEPPRGWKGSLRGGGQEGKLRHGGYRPFPSSRRLLKRREEPAKHRRRTAGWARPSRSKSPPEQRIPDERELSKSPSRDLTQGMPRSHPGASSLAL